MIAFGKTQTFAAGLAENAVGIHDGAVKLCGTTKPFPECVGMS